MEKSRPRLAIVCTHPIQYYAPVFRSMTELNLVEVRVFYTYSQAAEDSVFDSGFGADVKWDVPLLEGYDYTFVRNVAKRPGAGSFRGTGYANTGDRGRRLDGGRCAYLHLEFSISLAGLAAIQGARASAVPRRFDSVGSPSVVARAGAAHISNLGVQPRRPCHCGRNE